MKILNLVDNDKSDIKYQIINYPDGQRDIVLLESGTWIIKAVKGDSTGHYVTQIESVQIKSRLNNAEDLLMIVCATKALRNLKVKEIHLYVPYIMGLRSDRLFQEGGNRYVKDIIAPILNMQNYESVTCIDAHSSVAENCINNLVNISNLDLVNDALHRIYQSNDKKGGGYSHEDLLSNVILVSPDAGASHKIYKLAEQIGYKGDIITCSKERDKDGKLTQCKVPIKEEQLKKDIVLIDDIFDFGGTFKNIAATLNDAGHFGKKYLIVTHSIQTEGLKDALKYFDTIYTTNSYKNHGIEAVKQLNVF